ncbi:hypothetical protein COC60_06460 [Bacillus thuringiensis]|uniref:Uncharacterized protein n=2 Tax=Bacillus thuringiensis TaxID=1428 RepID=A0ABD6SG90_BACTU|nr:MULTISPECIES: hypothetical protein [Bacillus]KIZ30185.1 hypothetical protein SK30_11845 [Bacillus cereus]MBJ8127381.1 hypothetical protein [Bacillus cereus]PEF29425.1 hypothetical protein CON39_16625 [Bacillus thuringiensis]PES78948.1 hypothetical protein CN511_24990 [Bacillus thuringiensis]PET86444.1 hypothetical protein CN529_25390 [Bacillus thuringiensis]
MKYILTGINVLFSLSILISGLKYFKNTIVTYKNDIELKYSMTRSVYSIAVDSVFICIFILTPNWINNSEVDFLVDVILPSFIIVGGIESIQYLFLNLQSNNKYLILIILGVLNGVFIQ